MWASSIFPPFACAFSLLSPLCRIVCDLWHFVPTVSFSLTHTHTSPPPAPSSVTSLFPNSISASLVEEKLPLPHIAKLISRRHVRGWEHFIQQVTCGRLRRSRFKVVLSPARHVCGIVGTISRLFQERHWKGGGEMEKLNCSESTSTRCGSLKGHGCPKNETSTTPRPRLKQKSAEDHETDSKSFTGQHKMTN